MKEPPDLVKIDAIAQGQAKNIMFKLTLGKTKSTTNMQLDSQRVLATEHNDQSDN